MAEATGIVVNSRIPGPGRVDIGAGLACLLVPGLGQLLQRRYFKAGLFCVCIYFLFFYGWHLGNYINVYLPRAHECAPRAKNWTTVTAGPLSIPFPKAIYYRLQFAGQLGTGIVAWPAIIQFWAVDEEDPNAKPLPLIGLIMRAPPEQKLNLMQTHGTILWELAWVFTVAAGLLNILVAYDAYAGPGGPEARSNS
jgi:hypothetical protein